MFLRTSNSHLPLLGARRRYAPHDVAVTNKNKIKRETEMDIKKNDATKILTCYKTSSICPEINPVSNIPPTGKYYYCCYFKIYFGKNFWTL